MRRLLTFGFLVAIASLTACGPEVPDIRTDAGPQGPITGEDPRCPNRIVPSQACTIERLECPLYDAMMLRCTCISDEWRCGI